VINYNALSKRQAPAPEVKDMWSKVKLITLVVVSVLALNLALAPVTTFVSPAKATVGWTKYSGELTLNDEYVVDSCVIKDGSTYRMWYTHGKTDLTISQIYNDVKGLSLTNLVTDVKNLDEDQFLNHLSDLNSDTATIKALADGSSAVIGYATSSDGKTWTVQASNAFPGSTLSAWNSVGAPCVIKDDSTYKMWYSGVKTTLTEVQLQNILTNLGVSANRSDAASDLLNSTYTYIGYAHSTDGASWTDQGEVFSSSSSNWTVLNSVGAPCVIKDGSTYRMWYTRIKTDVTQALLNSILTDIGTGDFSLNQLLDLLDGTATVIGYATSSDGITGWAVQDSEVLPGSTPLWESVGDPCVINNDGTYEMWYTNSDTVLTKVNLTSLIDEVWILDMVGLWNSAASANLTDFLTDLLTEAGSLNITTIKSLLTGSRSTIGHATSTDGTNWSIVSAQNLTGKGNNPWGSAAAPTVVKSGTQYEMWYTDGVDDVTWQNFLDLLLGTDLPIGYATYQEAEEPSPSTGPSAGAAPGSTYVSDKVMSNGQFIASVTAKSDDKLCSVAIAKDTIGLNKYGNPLTKITVVHTDEPPTPPKHHNIMGLAYEFGPDGATFNPPITVTFTYDESLIPAEVDEANLVIAVWNATTGDWDKLDSVVDTATNTITAKISHFSTLTVLVSTRPAAFVTSDLSISPAEVGIGETVTISLQVTNTGDLEGTCEVTLKIDNVVIETSEVTLASGASQKVTFTTSRDVAGTYNVSANGLSGTFKVKEVAAPPPPPRPIPPTFTTSVLTISPTMVDIGETVTISVLVTNTGDLEGTYQVTLRIDGVAVATRDVTLAGGTSQEVTFTTSKDTAGIYTVSIDDQTGTITVKEEAAPPPPPPPTPPPPPPPFNWWLVIGPVIGVIVIGIIVWLVVIRRRE